MCNQVNSLQDAYGLPVITIALRTAFPQPCARLNARKL
ncbi:hypothetical protein UUU_33880 [Klebsiella pneumoniae subsp. pneumoniae DSM 30104 = JCM 1662 = NBRC 14940]|nr:hypothetical protein UUU_33880 [Klebsiella pneumoniae subsp. pneumoniae DSM 30104 = JCM 1662 = NBRC 14940]